MDRSEIIERAADFVDREGWDALSLSRLARETERHPSSMYSHVTGLPDLQRAISVLAATELADAVWRASLGKTSEDALEAIAAEYGAFAEHHPGRTAALAAVDEDDPEFAAAAAHLHEPLRAAFASFGLDDDQAATAHRLFGALIHGLVRTRATSALREAVALFVAAMTTGGWPAAGVGPTAR